MNNTKQIKQTLGRIFDTFSSKGGVYTIKKSYYWGFTEDQRIQMNRAIIQPRLEDPDVVVSCDERN